MEDNQKRAQQVMPPDVHRIAWGRSTISSLLFYSPDAAKGTRKLKSGSRTEKTRCEAFDQPERTNHSPAKLRHSFTNARNTHTHTLPHTPSAPRQSPDTDWRAAGDEEECWLKKTKKKRTLGGPRTVFVLSRNN